MTSWIANGFWGTHGFAVWQSNGKLVPKNLQQIRKLPSFGGRPNLKTPNSFHPRSKMSITRHHQKLSCSCLLIQPSQFFFQDFQTASSPSPPGIKFNQALNYDTPTAKMTKMWCGRSAANLPWDLPKTTFAEESSLRSVEWLQQFFNGQKSLQALQWRNFLGNVKFFTKRNHRAVGGTTWLTSTNTPNQQKVRRLGHKTPTKIIRCSSPVNSPNLVNLTDPVCPLVDWSSGTEPNLTPTFPAVLV